MRIVIISNSNSIVNNHDIFAGLMIAGLFVCVAVVPVA